MAKRVKTNQPQTDSSSNINCPSSSLPTRISIDIVHWTFFSCYCHCPISVSSWSLFMKLFHHSPASISPSQSQVWRRDVQASLPETWLRMSVPKQSPVAKMKTNWTKSHALRFVDGDDKGWLRWCLLMPVWTGPVTWTCVFGIEVFLHVMEALDVAYRLSHKGLQMVCLRWGRTSKTSFWYAEPLNGVRIVGGDKLSPP